MSGELASKVGYGLVFLGALASKVGYGLIFLGAEVTVDTTNRTLEG